MIYEADKGMTLQQAAIAALKAGCDRVLYLDAVYDVEVSTKRMGRLVADVPPNPPPFPD